MEATEVGSSGLKISQSTPSTTEEDVVKLKVSGSNNSNNNANANVKYNTKHNQTIEEKITSYQYTNREKMLMRELKRLQDFQNFLVTQIDQLGQYQTSRY